jgi:hypothetical protein
MNELAETLQADHSILPDPDSGKALAEHYRGHFEARSSKILQEFV